MNLTIIIPVHNGYEFVKPCIESVIKNSPPNVPIWVIDDGSTDQQTIDYLASIDDGSRILLLCNPKSLGFVGTVNRGISESTGDVIVLNSDTVVPPGWVERLEWARKLRGPVAAVCPVSSSASIVSVPNPGNNLLPDWISVDEMDRIVQETSNREFPLLPTVMGFCMLLTRNAIDKIGGLGVEWGRGYGDEVDWCLRARQAGFVCVLCDDLFIWHKGRASFGEGTQAKADRDHAVWLLKSKWPGYEKELVDWWDSAPQRAHRMRIFDRLRIRPRGVKRPKVLYLLHNWGGFGGLEVYTRRLVKALDDRVEFSVMYPTRAGFDVDCCINIGPIGVTQIMLNPRLVYADLYVREFPLDIVAPKVEHWFEQILEGLKPDIVHFHHLAGFGSMRLPRIAKDNGAKTVLSVCDDFFLCPLLRLGGECTKVQCTGDAQCMTCIASEGRMRPIKDIKHNALKVRLDMRAMSMKFLRDACDVIDVPSEYLKASLVAAGWIAEDIRVIPHGIHQDRMIPLYRPEPGKLRVGWFGAGSEKKGFGTFCEAARLLKDNHALEFHVIAPIDGQVSLRGLEHVKFHGAFEDGTLGMWLENIDVAVVAAMRNETYGSVVDEVVAHGVPVIVANVEAIKERYGCNTEALVFPYDWGDVGQLVDWLLTFSKSLPPRPASPPTVKSFKANALDYLNIYRELLE